MNKLCLNKLLYKHIIHMLQYIALVHFAYFVKVFGFNEGAPYNLSLSHVLYVQYINNAIAA